MGTDFTHYVVSLEKTSSLQCGTFVSIIQFLFKENRNFVCLKQRQENCSSIRLNNIHFEMYYYSGCLWLCRKFSKTEDAHQKKEPIIGSALLKRV
jgi:hypothetical protein